LTPYIAAVNRDIQDVLQRSIERRHVYTVTENRWSTAENAPTAEDQTCGIAPQNFKIGLLRRWANFGSLYLSRLCRYSRHFSGIGRLSTCLDNGQKSRVYDLKRPHHKWSNLLDRQISSSFRLVIFREVGLKIVFRRNMFFSRFRPF